MLGKMKYEHEVNYDHGENIQKWSNENDEFDANDENNVHVWNTYDSVENDNNAKANDKSE